MANGRVLYEGPSQFDGEPIVAVLTGLGRKSDNRKTADMNQAFILPQRMQDGRTSSVCGDCMHKPKAEGGAGSCYVNTSQTPATVWRTWKAGGYRPLDLTDMLTLRRLRTKSMRLGSWGDPAAVPFEVWEPLMAEAPGHTAYTHGWKRCDPRFKRIAMASCDTGAETLQALAKGWRPFRVRTGGEPLMPGEFDCPASAESGHRLTCADCLACWGADDVATRAFPGITLHGPVNRRRAFLTHFAKKETT